VHGWAAAGSNELWVDVTVVSPLGSSYLSAASAARGSAASAAAKHKHTYVVPQRYPPSEISGRIWTVSGRIWP
jgi:hypothetical protein